MEITVFVPGVWRVVANVAVLAISQILESIKNHWQDICFLIFNVSLPPNEGR